MNQSSSNGYMLMSYNIKDRPIDPNIPYTCKEKSLNSAIFCTSDLLL